jgi:hypothetical protein
VTTRRLIGSAAVRWYGVVGAPAAFALFHLAGVATSEAACSPVGIPGSLDTWSLALMLVAVLAALGAEAAALLTYRATRGSGKELPASRVHFLSVIGITVGVLFSALILMGGVGNLVLPECVQS